MLVAAAVVADASVPPELVDAEGAKKAVSVVQLVIVSDPGSNESPGGLDSRVGTESGNLLGLATYRQKITTKKT